MENSAGPKDGWPNSSARSVSTAQSTEPKDGALGIVFIFWKVVDSAAKPILLFKQADLIAELRSGAKSRVQSTCTLTDHGDVTEEWSLTFPILSSNGWGEASE